MLKRLSPVSPLVAVAGGTLTGLAAPRSLQISRGSLPVWLGADLFTIVTHAFTKVRIALVSIALTAQIWRGAWTAAGR